MQYPHQLDEKKRCQILQILFVIFHHSKNIQCTRKNLALSKLAALKKISLYKSIFERCRERYIVRDCASGITKVYFTLLPLNLSSCIAQQQNNDISVSKFSESLKYVFCKKSLRKIQLWIVEDFFLHKKVPLCSTIQVPFCEEKSV